MELKYYTILTSPQYNNPSLLVKDWNKENYPFGFGGLNHDGTECIWAEKQEVYLKKDVDEAIAELKKKLMPCLNGDCILTCEVVEKYGKENAELKAKLDKTIAERDGDQVCIDALKRYIYRLKEEKAQLKDKLEQEQLLRSYWNEDDYAMVNELERLSNENEKLKQKLESVQASMYADVVDANMDNRRLCRALWIARAKRAIEKISWFKLWNASISTMNPEDGARQEYDKWKKSLGKFLKKAEEYK